MNFSELVRGERERQYKTPAEFHRKAELSCSYVAYTGIEKGTVPKVELALEIIRALGLSERRALMAWARSQMPDVSSESVFTEAGEDVAGEYGDFARPVGAVLSKAQAKLLTGEPLYGEILLYLTARKDIGGAPAREIAKALAVDVRRTTNLLTFLVDYGLVEKPEDDAYTVAGFLNFPGGSEFLSLKAAVFERAAKNFLGHPSAEACSSTLTRRFSTAQVQEVRARLATFLAALDALPAAVPDDAVYTVGAFASPHRWGTP